MFICRASCSLFPACPPVRAGIADLIVEESGLRCILLPMLVASGGCLWVHASMFVACAEQLALCIGHASLPALCRPAAHIPESGPTDADSLVRVLLRVPSLQPKVLEMVLQKVGPLPCTLADELLLLCSVVWLWWVCVELLK